MKENNHYLPQHHSNTQSKSSSPSLLPAERRRRSIRTRGGPAATRTSTIPPACFVCPLSRQVMDDPVLDHCAHTFERTAIVEWLNHHGHCCPISRKPLYEHELLPNHTLSERMDKWKWQQEFYYSNKYNSEDDDDEEQQRRRQVVPDVADRSAGDEFINNCSLSNGQKKRINETAISTGDAADLLNVIESSTEEQLHHQLFTLSALKKDDQQHSHDTTTFASSSSEDEDNDDDHVRSNRRNRFRRFDAQRIRWPKPRRGLSSASAAATTTDIPVEFMLLPQERQALEVWNARAAVEQQSIRWSQWKRLLLKITIVVLVLVALGLVATKWYYVVGYLDNLLHGTPSPSDESPSVEETVPHQT